MAEMETGRIIAAYLKIRNVKDAYVRASNAVVAEYNGKLDRLGAELLDRMNKQKVKGLRGEAGSVSKVKDIVPTASDWNAFYEWVRETNSFEALERRIKKTFIQEFMEENKDEDGQAILPPGVSVLRTFKAVVKKAPKEKGQAPDAEE